MNDPWDDKSLKSSSCYVSCMKINGTPLLPPILSKEGVKEMQYYKLLAKEVENRISLINSYLNGDANSVNDKTTPEKKDEKIFKEKRVISTDQHDTSQKTISNNKKDLQSCSCLSKGSNCNKCVNSNQPSTKVIIDHNISEATNNKILMDDSKYSNCFNDVPERDYDCCNRVKQNEIANIEKSGASKANINLTKDNFLKNDNIFKEISLCQDGPSSLTSLKSFTGSLNDLHTEGAKEALIIPKLVRQRSYTLLKPSPQLLAHLEVQSLTKGVDMTSISMSDSVSNLSSPLKKRKSWDFESAKMKWSYMALELQAKNLPQISKKVSRNSVSKAIVKNNGNMSQKSQSLTIDKPKREAVKITSKSEPTSAIKKAWSPKTNTPVNHIIIKDSQNDNQANTKRLISNAEDPVAKIRELYEKIRHQQQAQMANLLEKQKKEQLFLQHVFDEQNKLLMRNLRTLYPKPTEAKQAWLDESNSNHGPVSLSQLINPASAKSPNESTVSSTTQTNIYEDVVKNKLSDNQRNYPTSNYRVIAKRRSTDIDSKTRTNSPSVRNNSVSRKLRYETSASTDREYEQSSTDRTNDTLADLNVTFPSDLSDDCEQSRENTVLNLATPTNSPLTRIIKSQEMDVVVNGLEETIQNSLRNVHAGFHKRKILRGKPTTEEKEAATKLVAYAKGYLVRRLMRTEKVQATVQTIRDALVCALQLHQDREGIRGPDIDLHRRLIQQITAACYSLHDTFIASSPAERCAVIAADRARRKALATRRQSDLMSQSHSGVFPSQRKWYLAQSLMSQSIHETFSTVKSNDRSIPRRCPRR